MQVLIFCELGLKTPNHFTPQIGVFGPNRGSGGRGGAMLTPTNSFLLLEVVTSVPLLGEN